MAYPVQLAIDDTGLNKSNSGYQYIDFKPLGGALGPVSLATRLNRILV